MLDSHETYPLSDFVSNPEAHFARLEKTHTPEVLTVDGQAKGVLLDTETYEALRDQLSHLRAVSDLRAHMSQSKKNAPPQEPISEAERERRNALLDELTAETERLGLYR